MPNIEVKNKLVFVEDRPTVLIPLILNAIKESRVKADKIEVLYYWWDSDEREKYTEAFNREKKEQPELKGVELIPVDDSNIWDHLLPAVRNNDTIILDYSLRRMRPEYIVPTFITQVKKEDKDKADDEKKINNVYAYSVWGDFQDSVRDAAENNALHVDFGHWDEVAKSYSIKSFKNIGRETMTIEEVNH